MKSKDYKDIQKKKIFGLNIISVHKRVLITFLLTLTIVMIVIAYIQYINVEQKKERATHLAHTIGSETYEMLLAQLSKTQVLEAFILQSDGDMEGAQEIAEMLLVEEGVRNVLFAPKGIVEVVYPMENNEEVIGLNMYEDGLGNWEARAAIAEKKLYMAGPFELLQGGTGIAGRLPVFLETDQGELHFWGIVSVTLDFPDILDGSSIKDLNDQGFACEIWRVTPDTGKHQIILETETPVASQDIAYDYKISMFNAEWTVTVAALNPWYAETSFWVWLMIGILIAILVTMTSYHKEKIRMIEQREAERKIEHLKQEVEYEQSNMLLGQIRSHFFYHTLNSLQALIVLNPDDAYKMIDDFSRYMRFNLDSVTADDGLCTFKEEIRSIRAYIDINQKQLGERLKVNYDIPNIDFRIPVLSIQPIVENAILHGIKPKVGGGTINVRLEEREECMRVTIEDDGIGFEMNDSIFEKSVGMQNVKKRLSKFDGCNIQIESRLKVGTKVVVVYPKNL